MNFPFLPRPNCMTRDDILAAVELGHRKQAWYQTIDLGDGILTPGTFDHREYLPQYGLPDDLSGKRVLDVGTANGFFAFEMEKRGAREVVALDTLPPLTFEFCRDVRRSKARYVRASIFDVTADGLGGPFDLVFCGDLLLHLDDVVGCAKKLRALCNGTVIVASALLEGTDETEPLAHAPLAFGRVNMIGGPAKGDTFDFPVTWIGNRMFYRRLLTYAGFTNVEVVSTHRMRPREGSGTDIPDILHVVVRGEVPHED
jgi:tRNA (mo5U34)-methyltransferase